LQNYANVELNLRGFAQSKRFHDPEQLKQFALKRGLLSAFLCVSPPLREQGFDWPKGCYINEQS
jgi:hypothetical protein